MPPELWEYLKKLGKAFYGAEGGKIAAKNMTAEERSAPAKKPQWRRGRSGRRINWRGSVRPSVPRHGQRTDFSGNPDVVAHVRGIEPIRKTESRPVIADYPPEAGRQALRAIGSGLAK